MRFLHLAFVGVRVVTCVLSILGGFLFFFFKQKKAYEMRISDWSSDVCSSDLDLLGDGVELGVARGVEHRPVEPLVVVDVELEEFRAVRQRADRKSVV